MTPRLGCPHTAWLSFIELDEAVVHVIRLASFLCLWFQCVCPLMPSRNTYRLTWVSLTLDAVENSERDGNTRPPELPLEKPICRLGSNS